MVEKSSTRSVIKATNPEVAAKKGVASPSRRREGSLGQISSYRQKRRFH